MSDQPYKQLSIEAVYKRWAVAACNAKHYQKALQLMPENDDFAKDYARWDLEEKLLITEIERRANLFPMPVLHDVINSCTPFSFKV